MTLTLAAGYGFVWLINRLRKSQLSAKLTTSIAVIVALLIPVIALAGNFAFNNRHRYFIARDYVENILKTTEPNGMLLTDDWQVYSPLLYLREVEGVRRDIDENGDLLVRRAGKVDVARRKLLPALGVPSWLDLETRGPRT